MRAETKCSGDIEKEDECLKLEIGRKKGIRSFLPPDRQASRHTLPGRRTV